MFRKQLKLKDTMEIFFYKTFNSSAILPVNLEASKEEDFYRQIEMPLVEKPKKFTETEIVKILNLLLFLEKHDIIYGDIKLDHILIRADNHDIVLIDYNLYTINNLQHLFKTQSYGCYWLDSACPNYYHKNYLWSIGITIFIALILEENHMSFELQSSIIDRLSWQKELDKYIHHPWYELVRVCTNIDSGYLSLKEIKNISPIYLQEAPGDIYYGYNGTIPVNWNSKHDYHIRKLLLEYCRHEEIAILAILSWWRYGLIYNYSIEACIVMIIFAMTIYGEIKENTIDELIICLDQYILLNRDVDSLIQEVINIRDDFYENHLGFKLPSFIFDKLIDASEYGLYMVSNPLTIDDNRQKIKMGQKIKVPRYIYQILGNDKDKKWMRIDIPSYRRSLSV